MENFEFKSKVRVAISGKCNLKCKYCDNARTSDKNRSVSMEDFRKNPISQGNISTEECLEILRFFLDSGYDRIDFTGGEPMLNPDWPLIVKETKNMGFKSVEMTTNGTLIDQYLDKNRHFPLELDRLIVSLDTYDPIKYKEIVGKDIDLIQIVKGIQRLKVCNPTLKITANCVLCQSSVFSLHEYINFIKDSGFDSITFLDLVVRDKTKKAEIEFFLKEFLSGEEVKAKLKQIYGELPTTSGRHGYNITIPNGLNISVVDTKGPTRRDTHCEACDNFCQEGLYTAKMATDGTIIDCLGAGGSVIDGVSCLSNGKLGMKIDELYHRLACSTEGLHFDRFYNSLL